MNWEEYFKQNNIEVQEKSGIWFLPLHRIFMAVQEKMTQELSNRIMTFIERTGVAILVAVEGKCVLYAYARDGSPFMCECHFNGATLVVHSEETPYVNKTGTALSAFINTTSEQYEQEEKPITWEQFFMGIASLTARRSKDPKTKVGACIVDDENKILSIGYNGMPRGCDDIPAVWNTTTKHDFVVHAELNAILNYRGESLKGTRIYVTHYPCNECAKAIIQAGIKEIIYLNESNLAKSQAATEMFGHAGINVRRY